MKKPGRAVALLAVIVLAPVVFALAKPEVRTRLNVLWLARRLDSRDPMVRAETRQKLLALGHPAVDPVFPRLVAGELRDELVGQTLPIVFVGRCAQPSLKSDNYVVLECELNLLGADSVERGIVRNGIVCPTAEKLFSPTAPRQLYLIVPQWSDDGRFATPLVRLAVPLDNETGPAVIEAVKRELDAIAAVASTR